MDSSKTAENPSGFKFPYSLEKSINKLFAISMGASALTCLVEAGNGSPASGSETGYLPTEFRAPFVIFMLLSA
jgi:hypothetical protein